MQVEDEESRVFRSSDRAREHKGEGREDERCIGLADTKVCQGYIEVLRVGKLLLVIY